jgi:hypothetical protein
MGQTLSEPVVDKVSILDLSYYEIEPRFLKVSLPLLSPVGQR